jgi:hypothetical protein
METTITELLITGGIPLGAVVGAWIHVKVNVGTLTTKIEYLEKALIEEKEGNKANYTLLTEKMDSVFKVLTEIKVSIASNK